MSFQTIYNCARAHPSKTAVVYNGDAISYCSFASAIADMLRHLESEALPQGDTVVVRISCLVDCWVAVLALQQLGLTTICVSSASIIQSLSLKGIGAIVTTEIEAGIDPIKLEHSMGERTVLVPNPNYNDGKMPAAPPGNNTTAIGGHILYTSGTTGNYKKVYLDAERQHARNAERNRTQAHRDEDTVYNCTGFGLWTALGYKRPLAVWHMGGCTVLEQRPDWFRHFLQESMTNAVLIPDQVNTLLAFLNNEPAAKPVKDFYLLVGGGFISNNLAGQLLDRVSGYLENIYVSTEINVPILRSVVNAPDDLHWMEPSGYREVEIVTEDGNPCRPDEEGILRVRCTDLDCASYEGDLEASARMFRAGYFYPGDMATQRTDGRIRILGRSADVINVRGQKRPVAPFEEEIQRRLGIDTVCVFSGLTREGEAELLIALECETWPDKSELQNLVGEFKKFGQIRVTRITKFPRTQTGTSKIDRIALRKQIFQSN